jgi:hypothetical protein
MTPSTWNGGSHTSKLVTLSTAYKERLPYEEVKLHIFSDFGT